MGKVSKCTILESEGKYKLKHELSVNIFIIFIVFFNFTIYYYKNIQRKNNTLTEGITAVLLFVENNSMETGFIN